MLSRLLSQFTTSKQVNNENESIDNSIVIGDNNIISGKFQNITARNGVIMVDGKIVTAYGDKNSSIIINGNVNSIQSSGNISVSGNVGGDVSCHGNVSVSGYVNGDIDCGGNMQCEFSSGNLRAGGKININRFIKG